MIAPDANTRRWQRYPVELPVRIFPCSRLPATAVVGRGTRLSEGGMALYAGVEMEPDDLIEIEFPTPNPVRVMAAVRNRSGHSFGLEFLAWAEQPAGLPVIFPSGRGSREFWASRVCLRDHSRL
jgi:PilZ domain